MATTGSGNGTGETWNVLPQGLTAAVGENNGSWSAELRIDDARLNGWNHLAKMQAGHYGRFGFNSDTTWPNQSSYYAPNTWGLATLGKFTQSITCAPLPDRTQAELPFTASSGLPVVFTARQQQLLPGSQCDAQFHRQPCTHWRADLSAADLKADTIVLDFRSASRKLRKSAASRSRRGMILIPSLDIFRLLLRGLYEWLYAGFMPA